MGKIFITSDYHFNHNKDFIYKARGFETIEQMNEAIIKNHNDMITNDDDVYLLGDCMLGQDLEASLSLMKRLNGKLHIIRGNHDSNRRWEAYNELSNVIERVTAVYLDYKHYHFYLSHFPTITSNNDYEKPLKARILNLCGHTHTLNPWEDIDKGYIYHCEVDAHYCCPIELDKIIEAFENWKQADENRAKEICSDPLIPLLDYKDDKCKFCTQYLQTCTGPIMWGTPCCPQGKTFSPNGLQNTKCNKCVWQYNGCPGPTTSGCGDSYQYKRDPPDGGYYR